MVKNTQDHRLEQQHRLEAKTQDQRMINEIVDGTQMSPWEAQVVVQVIREVYFQDPGKAPLRTGQIRYECVRADQGAGKSLKECQMTAVTLTLLDPEDLQVRNQRGGAEAARRVRLVRLAEEARDQNGLLSQEDLAQILTCDVRTVRRDIQTLRDKTGIHVPTRGQQKDIGPGVTHRTLAIEKWMLGKEPPEIARDINHTLTAVERYLQHFSRVIFLAGNGFQPLQIAFTVGISTASVHGYLECYQKHKDTVGIRARLAELKSIGEAHWQGSDQKKGRLLQSAESTKSETTLMRP
jgi:biotin operon repressor